jgi:hypothetical protein
LVPVIPSSLTNKIVVEDARDDSKLVTLYRTDIIPEIKDYHDILTANVRKVNDNNLLLSIELAGDANRNEKYETVYIWIIYYANSISGKDQYYSVIIPNFAIDSNFEAVVGTWQFLITLEIHILFLYQRSPICQRTKLKCLLIEIS